MQRLIDQVIDATGGKWPSNDFRCRAQKTLITRAEFEARKAERQSKPSWPCGYSQIIQNAWGEWFGSNSKQPWHPCVKDWSLWAPLGVKGEVIGQWADTWEQRPNHIGESDEKVSTYAEIQQAAQACERALNEFFPEVKLGEFDWYDYDKQEATKLPPVGMACECFNYETNEFVKVKVLDAVTGSREIAAATINGDSFGWVFWGCKFRPLDWNRNLQPNPEPEPSPELSFHLSNAFNELQASARLLPEDDPRRAQLVALASGVSAVKEVA